MIIHTHFLTIRANFAIRRNVFSHASSIVFSTNRNFNFWSRKVICFEIVMIYTKNFLFRSRLIVSSRQEIDFEIDFIKLCKTKLNTTSLWFKQIRKIELSSNFWSKIEKTISLFRSKIVRHVNCKISTKQFVLIYISFREFCFFWNVSLTSFLFSNKNVFLLKLEQLYDHWLS